ncbi:MAG: type II secretion system protein [Deltaproteobacteria bacterium]|nr:type II secretion system protein [Deltaproteobacteria bacterium]MBI2540937.1 type II secretion system protein [Deltaproteobacteria bacterium]
MAKFELRNSKFKRGFTLLEVVVAMAIVGLGVMTLFEALSAGLRLETRSSDQTKAITYSRQAIDGFLIRRGIRDGGEEGSAGGGYRWSVEVRPFQESPQLSSVRWDLKEVRLRMRYREGEREQEVELKTLRLLKKNNP